MIYLGWFDDNGKKSIATKINEAIERHEQKYGTTPNVCLVSLKEDTTHPHITVRAVRHLRPNYYYVGVE